MAKMIARIKEVFDEVKTGIDIYLLARRYSRRNRGITTKSILRAIYEKD